jgi:Polyketide cyclase / dehydrase and lipid transport
MRIHKSNDCSYYSCIPNFLLFIMTFSFHRRWFRFIFASFIVCWLLSIAACASIAQVDTSSSSSSSSKEPMKVFEVAITREAVIPGSVKDVFAFITAQDVLPKVLTGYGPLPAVVRTSEISGPWDVPGSSRIVHLADGTTVREQVTHFSSPTGFAYRIFEFGNPIVGALATGARGEWTFSEDPGGTKVRWTYTFLAKNGLTAIPLSGITQILWRGYMDVCLDNSIRIMGAVRKGSV